MTYLFNMQIEDLLNRTIQCKLCKGNGGSKDKPCKECSGTGIVFDNFVTDVLIEAGLNGHDLTEKAVAIYDHYGKKLVESYKRGFTDGENTKPVKKLKEKK